MADFLIDGRIVTKNEPWRAFMVYGGFTEPTMGRNFIVVRIPSGRVKWSKKIAPAIRRLVSPWFPRATDKYWNVDGESVIRPGDRRLWDTDVTVRYEWNGECLIKV